MKVNRNGLDIHLQLSGPQDAPVVVLSHSLATSLEIWMNQCRILEADFRVLRYDTRGHGESAAPEGAYTLEGLADDVIGVLDALGIQRAHFVGISMGGMIGQRLALDHPQRLSSLVLCDTAATIPDEAQPIWQQRIDTARRLGMKALARETLQRWFTPGFLEKNPPQVQRIHELILSTPVAGFVGCSEAIRRLNLLDRLAQIELPTLIVVGEDDPGTPPSNSEAIHARISGSVLEIIPAAAHLCNIEQAERFNAILRDFLASITHPAH
jgi:3-oxoadipate enol-lactonase